MAAQFEIRRLDLAAARKILGTAIGMCPKEVLFKGYIQVEMDVRPSLSTIFDLTLSQLHEFDRVQTLYKKYIEVC